ncbi:hypothetical protein [Polyangium sp. 6x1]|uniref:hypothetical protein n=1 Tax=Polyangium sp. 6x1 TaxID=3042689 RepID=UPI002482908A|nr:hypothetical protein [Polyangium sp. 6x1]MDI1451828.1 hypothetical protein [Polyangium sp. 6x1]
MQAFTDNTCGTPKSGDPLISGDDYLTSPCTGSFSSYIYSQPVVAEPGSCAPGTVDPLGTVELADPVTFCCASD